MCETGREHPFRPPRPRSNMRPLIVVNARCPHVNPETPNPPEEGRGADVNASVLSDAAKTVPPPQHIGG